MNNIIIFIRKNLYYIFVAVFLIFSFLLKTNITRDFFLLEKGLKSILLVLLIFFNAQCIKLKTIKFFVIQNYCIGALFLSALFSNYILNSNTLYSAVLNPIEFFLVATGILSMFFVVQYDERYSYDKMFYMMLLIFAFLPFTHVLYEIIIRDASIIFVSVWKGFTWNPNNLGFLMLISGLSFLGLFIITDEKKDNYYKYLFLLGYYTSLFISFLTGSRNAILSLLIYFVYIVIVFKYYKRVKSLFWGSLVVSIVLFFIFYQTTGLLSFSLKKFNKVNVTSLRYDIWKHFLINIGKNFSKIEFAFGKGFLENLNLLYPKLSLHNTYFEFFGKYGMVGVTLLMAFIFQNLKKIFIFNKEKCFRFVMIVIFLFYNFFETQIFFDNLNLPVLFFFIILLSWGGAEQKNMESIL